jgi:hypothetical protein
LMSFCVDGVSVIQGCHMGVTIYIQYWFVTLRLVFIAWWIKQI